MSTIVTQLASYEHDPINLIKTLCQLLLTGGCEFGDVTQLPYKCQALLLAIDDVDCLEEYDEINDGDLWPYAPLFTMMMRLPSTLERDG